MNNSRKAKKAKRLAAYYYVRDDFQNALIHYIRAISFKDESPFLAEQNYHFIAYCYYEIWDLEKSLLYITECLSISKWYLEWKRFYFYY